MLLKDRLKRGEKVCGIMLSELYTPNIVRILSNAGFDFILIDCEHGYFDKSQVANLISVADGHGIDTIIRVNDDSIGSVERYLDMGARGILMSNTTTAKQAYELAHRCLYAPQGDRGVSTFRAHTNYSSDHVVELLKVANQSNIVIAQIESQLPPEDLEAICTTEGIDGILIGPNDLTQRMGILGQYDAPEVQEFFMMVRQISQRCGKWSGVITSNDALLSYCVGIGMNCFSVGSELNALANGACLIHKKAKSIFSVKE